MRKTERSFSDKYSSREEVLKILPTLKDPQKMADSSCLITLMWSAQVDELSLINRAFQQLSKSEQIARFTIFLQGLSQPRIEPGLPHIGGDASNLWPHQGSPVRHLKDVKDRVQSKWERKELRGNSKIKEKKKERFNYNVLREIRENIAFIKDELDSLNKKNLQKRLLRN